MKDIEFFRHAMLHHAPMQDALNEAAIGNWRQANSNWGRAITAEAGELQNHMRREWWTSKTTDHAQAFLEVVDIYRFWLSAAIQHEFGSEIGNSRREAHIWDARQRRTEGASLMSVVDFLMMEAAGLAVSAEDGNRTTHIDPIARVVNIGHAMLSITRLLDRQPEDILTQYVSKHTLDTTRRENGHKERAYGAAEDRH